MLSPMLVCAAATLLVPLLVAVLPAACFDDPAMAGTLEYESQLTTRRKPCHVCLDDVERIDIYRARAAHLMVSPPTTRRRSPRPPPGLRGCRRASGRTGSWRR